MGIAARVENPAKRLDEIYRTQLTQEKQPMEAASAALIAMAASYTTK